jgi:hypothetical protein
VGNGVLIGTDAVEVESGGIGVEEVQVVRKSEIDRRNMVSFIFLSGIKKAASRPPLID